MVTVEVSPVQESEKSKLWEALQSYLAELSTLGGRAAANGGFAYRYFDSYWDEPGRWPFWIESAGRVAGFALVRKDEDGTFEMAEFFIQPELRRHAIGVAGARMLFAHFPGLWRLSEFTQNVAAIAFWRRVLQGFAAYQETSGSSRVEQTFDSRRAK